LSSLGHDLRRLREGGHQRHKDGATRSGGGSRFDGKQVTVEGADDDGAIQQAVESASFEYGGPA
jgi:hypothetical protein